MDQNQLLWQKCADFHGHICGGLTIGYKAALCARELLGADFSEDEDIVCVTENDACGVDAIQVVLGCSVGKGNLLFRIRGKQAFSFFARKSGRSLRLVLRELPQHDDKDAWQRYLFAAAPADLFDVGEPGFALPERARIFGSARCDRCGEKTAEHLIRLQGEERLCLDCFPAYDRFSI